MANEDCNKVLSRLIENCLWVETYLAIWHRIEMSTGQKHLSYYQNLTEAITKSLISSSIMDLSNIYYKPKDPGADIETFLNRIDSDKYFIDSEKIKEIKEFAKNQMKKLKEEDMKKLRDNLVTWRDKFYAHNDKCFLVDILNTEYDLSAEEKLHKEYPINVKELEQLLEFTVFTTNHLCYLINGYSIKNDIKMRCEKEIDLLFEKLGEHRQIHLKAIEKLQKEPQGKSKAMSIGSDDDTNDL